MRRRQRRLVKIYPTEQTQTKQERLSQLQQAVLEGEKAKIILEYADKTFEDAENYVLAKMLEPKADLTQIQADYRAAYAFYQKVKASVVEGAVAYNKLKEMNENE